MAKQGMSRPDRTHTKPRSDAPPVPEISGKAKVYPGTDNDLARDNIENDITAADLQDL